MKKLLLILVAVFGLGTASFAQMGPVSLGLELALPLGDFGDAYSIGYGLSAGYEHPVGDKLGITAQVGYVMLAVDDELSDFIDRAAMLPVQAGLKYYLTERGNGPYVHGQLGIHSLSVTTNDIDLGILGTIEGESASESYFSFAVGAGYELNNKLDIGLRFNSISPDSDLEGAKASNYIGVRVAYNLFGGE
jgi:hypothetical protein